MRNSMKSLNEGIGIRIGEMRRKRRLTQEQLAEQMDVTVKHISSVERGVSALSLAKLIAASNVLDCTLDYMILGNNPEEATRKIPSSFLTVLNSDDEREAALALEYMNMFCKIQSTKK